MTSVLRGKQRKFGRTITFIVTQRLEHDETLNFDHIDLTGAIIGPWVVFPRSRGAVVISVVFLVIIIIVLTTAARLLRAAWRFGFGARAFAIGREAARRWGGARARLAVSC